MTLKGTGSFSKPLDDPYAEFWGWVVVVATAALPGSDDFRPIATGGFC